MIALLEVEDRQSVVKRRTKSRLSQFLQRVLTQCDGVLPDRYLAQRKTVKTNDEPDRRADCDHTHGSALLNVHQPGRDQDRPTDASSNSVSVHREMRMVR